MTSPVQSVNFEDCVTGEAYQPDMSASGTISISSNFDTPPIDWTVSVVNDTATDLVYHTFVQENPHHTVQVYFDPPQPDIILDLTLYVSFNDTPNNVRYELTTRLQALPENLEEEEETGEPRIPEYPLTYIFPKNFTNRTGPFTIAVWVIGK